MTDKVKLLDNSSAVGGLNAVLRHISVAAEHLSRGRDEANDDFFNDAVYRSNQAYEGVLKEAWLVFRGALDGRTTHQLEEGLEESGVLTPRAVGLLQNYRREWRNPSTHEHTLFLGEHDAFLAIVSVLALVSVLVDQIHEELLASADSAAEALPSDPGQPLNSLLARLIFDYIREGEAFFTDAGRARTEHEILGRLHAYTRGLASDLGWERERVVRDNLRPDLIISRRDEQVLVELMRGSQNAEKVRAAISQMRLYLEAAHIEAGILVVSPSDPLAEFQQSATVTQYGDGRRFVISILAPNSVLLD